MGKRTTASAAAQINDVIRGQNAIIATIKMAEIRRPSFTSSETMDVVIGDKSVSETNEDFLKRSGCVSMNQKKNALATILFSSFMKQQCQNGR
jgi:hypothetical protein